MMIIRAITISVVILLAALTRIAAAHELSLFAGRMQETDTNEPSYAWQIEFRNWMNDQFAVSLSYLNEGHVPYHHRDGGAVQAWVRTDMFERRLSLSGAAGPYYYFDSTHPESGIGYANEHGWGIIGSLGLAWYDASPLVYQIRANVVRTGSMDTHSVLFGAGYQWDIQPWLRDPAQTSIAINAAQKNELAVFSGVTIVNSFESERSLAACVEYRRRLGRYLEGTIAALDEGKSEGIDRRGAALQLWLSRELFDGLGSIGFGGGGYYMRDGVRPTDHGERLYFLSGMASVTASWRIDADWKLRTTWSRVHTNYHRDTDVILLGLAHIF